MNGSPFSPLIPEKEKNKLWLSLLYVTLTLGVSEEVSSIIISPPVAAISPLAPGSPLSPFGPCILPTFFQLVSVSDQTYKSPLTK